ncbi:hypothetical protein LB577_27375 [Mesorhizobium sp. B283B1A]|uniref:hypothetical protein n=1 Tax=Mesorhizobium TaxID=68287 RepID=UPI001CD0C537|nr:MULTISPECIES: hypothetical protein [Mesorhizobium]MCA0050629.1 hypothetical protein [Mesorhizobium sp. B283B1A]UQS66939.1 hypothetical protein M5D98_11680 [Mesorhizobium opportunistum]
MTDLTVHITANSQDDRFLTFPVDVYSAVGDLVASGTASPNRPGSLTFADGKRGPLDRVHVFITPPSGETAQQIVELKSGKGEVHFDIRSTVPTEWLEWVTPFHPLDHLVSNTQAVIASRRPIGKVWMTLWSLLDGRWQSRSLDAENRLSDRSGVQQITVAVPDNPHLLQIGGDEFGWRLVTLPPAQRVRVALTRSAREKGDTIDVTVSREQPDNEILLAYLSGGAVTEANRLADIPEMADRLLEEKINDPISAVAAGYFLLRINKLAQRTDWVRNLMNWFPAIADGAILSATLAAQTTGAKDTEIRKSIGVALDRGLPIFSIGAALLHRTMSAVHRGRHETKRFHESYLALQAYVRAASPLGPYFAFRGLSPAEPTWVSIFGQEDNPGFGLSSDGTPLQRLVYARPATVRGRYGRTAVQLPLAPVSASAETEVQTQAVLEPLPSSGTPGVHIRPLGRQRNGRGLPFRETTFLSHLSLPTERSVTPDRPSSGSRKFAAPIGLRDEAIPDGIGTPPPPRQSERYWREQREANAVTVFED